MTSVLFDSNGYPEGAALDRLRNFTGSPADFASHAQSLFWAENTDSGTFVTERGRRFHWVSFTAGGWSGHQSVLEAIESTIWHIAYWNSSHRGGTVTYHIPGEDWLGNRGFWGGAVTPEPV